MKNIMKLFLKQFSESLGSSSGSLDDLDRQDEIDFSDSKNIKFPNIKTNPDMKGLEDYEKYLRYIDKKIDNTQDRRFLSLFMEQIDVLNFLDLDMSLDERILSWQIKAQISDLYNDIRNGREFKIDDTTLESLNNPDFFKDISGFKELYSLLVVKNKDKNRMKELVSTSDVIISFPKEYLNAGFSKEEVFSFIRKYITKNYSFTTINIFFKNIDEIIESIGPDLSYDISILLISFDDSDLNSGINKKTVSSLFNFLSAEKMLDMGFSEQQVQNLLCKSINNVNNIDGDDRTKLESLLQNIDSTNIKESINIFVKTQTFENVFFNLDIWVDYFGKNNFKEEVIKLMMINLRSVPITPFFRYKISYFLNDLNKFGFEKKYYIEILNILIDLGEHDTVFQAIMYSKDALNLSENEIFEYIDKTLGFGEGYSYIGFIDFKEIGLNNEKLFELAKKLAIDKKYNISNFTQLLESDYNIFSEDEIRSLFSIIMKSDRYFDIFDEFILYQENESIPNGFKNILPFLFDEMIGYPNSVKNTFFDNFTIKTIYEYRDSNIFLGKDYENLKQYFNKPEYFEIFIEKMCTNNESSKAISNSINDIYDYADETGINKHKELQKQLGNYSDIELFSFLGNNTINYSTTLQEVLNELDRRMQKKGFSDYFEFINKTSNINERTRKFLKGQTLTGLIARGRESFVDKIIENNGVDNIYGLIQEIIDYKNSDVFTQQMYFSVIIGIQNLLNSNPYIGQKIYEEYFQKQKNKQFRDSLIISLIVEGKTLDISGNIVSTNKDEIDKYYNITDKFSLPSKEIFETPTKQVMYIYTGSGAGGGTERYQIELQTYIRTYNYSVVESSKFYNVLEKDGVQAIFVNYDYLSDEDKEKLFGEEINPVLIAYRGHNYQTSEAILDTRQFVKNHPHTIVVDGGCRNVSKFLEYRQSGIDNQIVSYLDTGYGNETFNFTGSFITNYLRKPEIYEDRKITLNQFAKDNFSDKSYILNNMFFPGNTLDILQQIDSGKIMLEE